MNFLGLTIICLAVILAILNLAYPVKNTTANPNFIQRISWIWSLKKSFVLIGLGVVIILVNSMFFYNPAGTATAIQYLWGGDAAVTTQGVKLKFWGKTIPISFEIALQDR